jgi:hypothetical protein
MTLMAAAFPIVPGKTEEWKRFIGELNGPRRAEFEASRRALGVHERTYLQPTPMGDLVIVTLEGDDPATAFQTFANSTDEFARWFLASVKELHGFELKDVMKGPMPTQVIDSGQEMETLRARQGAKTTAG